MPFIALWVIGRLFAAMMLPVPVPARLTTTGPAGGLVSAVFESHFHLANKEY